MIQKSNRIAIGVNLNEYVVTLKKSSTVQIVPIDENIWVESVNLEWDHQDPVDRVVVAFARSNQAAIITADKEIANFYSEVIW
ncbi:MAG: PIN domain-containing protein [Nostoc sp.]|uniref:type II toxin-antitoxin system VapC family toxin n=1 Tax=Nostoc sp. TaxID=1180 RepID=UPI002FFD449D